MIYIEKDIISVNWDKMEEALSLLKPEFETTTVACPYCRRPIELPIIARESDILAFKRLMELAERYFKGKGLQDKMWDYIIAKIKDEQQRNKH